VAERHQGGIELDQRAPARGNDQPGKYEAGNCKTGDALRWRADAEAPLVGRP